MLAGLIRLPGDGDIYWQRWLGEMILRTHHLPRALGLETFTAVGAVWVPQEWLFSVGVAFARDHGMFAVFAVLVSLLPLCALLSVVARCRPALPPQAVGLALAFTGMAFAESFGIRAQVVGWCCFGWFLFFVERRDGWRYGAIPVAVVWANLHASVMLAPVVVLARVGAFALDRRWRDVAAEAAMLAGVTLAICCTPLGLTLPLYALTLTESPIRHFIKEWQPAGLGDTTIFIGALPLALAIIAGGRRILLERKAQALVAAVLFVGALFAIRNVPLFAIAAAPLAAAAVAARFPGVATLLVRRRDLEMVAVPAAAIAMLACGAAVLHEQKTSPPSLPVAAIATLANDGSPHRVFCEDFSWCSVALQYPRLRVFIDGRCDPFPLSVWRSYIDVADAAPRTASVLSFYAVDAIVANRHGVLARDLKPPQWRIAADDGAHVLFRRE